jgi:hypothetical protein
MKDTPGGAASTPRTNRAATLLALTGRTRAGTSQEIGSSSLRAKAAPAARSTPGHPSRATAGRNDALVAELGERRLHLPLVAGQDRTALTWIHWSADRSGSSMPRAFPVLSSEATASEIVTRP